MHRRSAGVVDSDTRLCFELFHSLRHGTLCGRAFAILPKSNSFAAFCHWWSRRCGACVWASVVRAMACAGVHRAFASTVRVRRPPSLPGVVGCFITNTTHGKFPFTVLAAVHGRFLRTKLRKCAHALAERGAVQHSDRLVVASRPHRAPHADSVGVRLARLGSFPESGAISALFQMKMFCFSC